MDKFNDHMDVLFKYCSMVVMFVLITQYIHAQAKNDTITLFDTLMDAPPVAANSDDTIFHFNKIALAPKIHPRTVPDSLVRALKANEDFWYANAAPMKKKQSKVKDNLPIGLPFYRQSWFKTLLWIIIIGAFTAVVIWYLAVSNISLFRKASPAINNADTDEQHNDIFAINYDSEISKALYTKNYRLTIRLLYLQTLKMLSERGLIQYKAEKTNSDYLWQLHGSIYYNDFFRLTRDFDYTWYGKFKVTETAFQIIHKDFTTFKNRL